MKTSVNNLEKCQVELTVELDAEATAAVVKDVEKAFLREAQLPGFRKGKVPMELIRREFATGLKQETERAVFSRNYEEAIKAEKLDVVAIDGVKEISCAKEGAKFVVLVEVKPTFKLPTYKGLKISKQDTKISDEDVNAQVERLRVAYAKFEDAKEGEACTAGDYVQIDYEGMVGKKKILEINPEAKIVGEGKGFWTQIEEGHFLPEILDAVKGMKAGETKTDIKAKFDKESAPDGLKGEKAVYTVTLKSFRRRILPTDAEFAEKAKVENVEKLIQQIRERMEKSADDNEALRRENEAVELLLKKADFDVPASQVNRAMDSYLKDLEERARYSGLDASYFKENAEKIRKDAEDAATRQVRLWYIVDAIAAEEKIEAADESKGKKVIDFILANAKN